MKFPRRNEIKKKTGNTKVPLSYKLFNNGRRHVGHNGEAAPRVCVPANVVSEFIELLCVIAAPANFDVWNLSGD